MSDPTREPLVGAAADRVRDQLAGAIAPATIAFLRAIDTVLTVPHPSSAADDPAYAEVLEDRVQSVRTSLADLLADPTQGLAFDTQWLLRRASGAIPYTTREQQGGGTRG